MPFFLFSLRRRTWSPFSSKKSFVLLAQVSSAAILFAENRYTEQFFVCFLTKKIFFEDFFSCSWKSTEISRENKNCGFPQKCGRLEALTDTLLGTFTYKWLKGNSNTLLCRYNTLNQNE